MEIEEYNFFQSITEKPKHWKVGDDGRLSATFSYVGVKPTKLLGMPFDVNVPSEKEVSFTKKQLQNIHRELYTRKQVLESEICDIEIEEEESNEAIAAYSQFGFGSNSSADKGELHAELEMAEYAEEIVSNALTMKDFVLEA